MSIWSSLSKSARFFNMSFLSNSLCRNSKTCIRDNTYCFNLPSRNSFNFPVRFFGVVSLSGASGILCTLRQISQPTRYDGEKKRTKEPRRKNIHNLFFALNNRSVNSTHTNQWINWIASVHWKLLELLEKNRYIKKKKRKKNQIYILF